MNLRDRLIKKWRKEFMQKAFKYAYEQGRFDEWADNNLNKK